MIIDGKKISEEILMELKKEISDKKLSLKLAAILVGDDPEFKKFVDLKGGAAEKIGVTFTIYKFPSDINEDELKKDIQEEFVKDFKIENLAKEIESLEKDSEDKDQYGRSLRHVFVNGKNFDKCGKNCKKEERLTFSA